MNGISVTTRNRPAVLDYSLKRIVEHSDAEIIVIDDASDQPEFNSEICEKHGVKYLLNEKRRGIPGSKARGFRSLLHCDRQFWFDDDCFPKRGDWIEAFMEGMERQPHLLYLRNWAHIKEKHRFDKLTSYTGASACLMSFTKEIYDQVEGFDIGHKLYGGWHHQLSIKLAVLDEYVSLTNAPDYLHSFDLDRPPGDFKYAFMSSLPKEERVRK